jgi:hypothetical protein
MAHATTGRDWLLAGQYGLLSMNRLEEQLDDESSNGPPD